MHKPLLLIMLVLLVIPYTIVIPYNTNNQYIVVNGDLVVSGTLSYDNAEVIVNGNVIILSNSKLILRNSKLLLNTTGGMRSIRLSSNSELSLEYSEISYLGKSYSYIIILNKAEIGSWYGVIKGTKGIKLYNSTMYLEETNITESTTPIYSEISMITIKRSRIENCIGEGINASMTKIYIEDSIFKNITYAITTEYSIETRIISSRFIDNAIAIESRGSNLYIKDTVFINNTVCGVYLVNSNTTIEGSVFINNRLGVFSNRGQKSLSLINNRFYNDGVYLYGLSPRDLILCSENNTVNDKPLVYILNKDSITIRDEAGQVIIVNSSNIKVEDLTITNTTAAIQVFFSEAISLGNTRLSNNIFGLTSMHSKLLIQDSEIYLNELTGAKISYSEVVIENTSITGNTGIGVYLGHSRAWINSSRIDSNGDGVLIDTSNTTIFYTEITSNNGAGLSISATPLQVYFYVEIHYCDIYGNKYHGIYNGNNYITVNATMNWWGSIHGPLYSLGADRDDPEEVYGNIIYSPWLSHSFKIPPIIINVQPLLNNTYVKGVIDLTIDIESRQELEEVLLYIDNQLVASYTSPRFTYTLDTTKYSDGLHKLVIRAISIRDVVNETTYVFC
ncbi:MAG: right-handed parallel beta-helix repeat-containing protein, partial [Desulfurococcales archaeon]|nr:right-handed parallel beta-helix repeat-containing protein [Desulfurococcales archaeon]